MKKKKKLDAHGSIFVLRGMLATIQRIDKEVIFDPIVSIQATRAKNEINGLINMLGG